MPLRHFAKQIRARSPVLTKKSHYFRGSETAVSEMAVSDVGLTKPERRYVSVGAVIEKGEADTENGKRGISPHFPFFSRYSFMASFTMSLRDIFFSMARNFMRV